MAVLAASRKRHIPARRFAIQMLELVVRGYARKIHNVQTLFAIAAECGGCALGGGYSALAPLSRRNARKWQDSASACLGFHPAVPLIRGW